LKRDFPFPWREPENSAPSYLMARNTESVVQASILTFLALYEVDAVPIDAGGRRQRGRMIGAAAAAGVDLKGVQNTKTGRAIPAGFADIEATLAPNGRALYIEVKAPRWLNSGGRQIKAAGKATDDQLAFLQSKFDRGAIVLVAWSCNEVWEYLSAELRANKEYLGKQRARA
jgi:hypothetical protein